MPNRTLTVLLATAFGFLGLCFSIAAISVQWLPIQWPFAQPKPQSEPRQPSQAQKKSRRRSAPTKGASPMSMPRSRTAKRVSAPPAVRPLSISSTTRPIHDRHVYFVDSPKSKSPRSSLDNDSLKSPSVESAPARPSASPRSSYSSTTTLVQSACSAVISLNDPLDECAADSDSSRSSRPSIYNFLPRVPNPLAPRKRYPSGGSVAFLSEKTQKPSGTASEPEDAITPARRSSLAWVNPWGTSRRPSSAGEGGETPRAPSRRTSLNSSTKSPSTGDCATSPTNGSNPSLVSFAYFSKKTTRRTSTPIPRTQPYAYPINAAVPTLDIDPPPYVKNDPLSAPVTLSEKSILQEKPPVSAPPMSQDHAAKRERNVQQQASLGLGRRPSSAPRRAVTIGP